MYTISDFLNLLSAAYILAFVAVAGLIAWRVRSPHWKWGSLAVVSVAFAYPLVTGYLEEKAIREKNRVIGERFQKLCKEKTGDRIVRTVDGVDGFFLMRPRKPTKDEKEYADQFLMWDPYGHSDYEARNPGPAFLRDRTGNTWDANIKNTPIAGFEFVELPNPDRETNSSAAKYIRITVLEKQTDKEGREKVWYQNTPVNELRSRYGVDWEDISTPEDRKVWTAGGRMRVVDLGTKEVIAERIGYVVDPMQLRRTSGGSWGDAQKTACPPFEVASDKMKEFVAKVLKSSRSK